MPVTLRELVEPVATAVLVMEMKRVTVGDLQASSAPGAPGNPLAAVGEAMGLVPNVARLLDAARRADVRVVHCTAAFRADGAAPAPTPILASAVKHRGRLLLGSPEAEPALELGRSPDDLHSVRLHGVAAFVGTELDAMLRNLDVRNVVLVGGSVNLGIVGTAIEAVDLGYRVVVPRDGVVGHPAEYADAVLVHTMPLVATVTDIDSVCAVGNGLSACMMTRPRCVA